MKILKYLTVAIVLIQTALFAGSLANPTGIINGKSMQFNLDPNENWYEFTITTNSNILISGTNYYNNYYIYDEDLGRVAYGSLDSDSVVLSAGKHYINIDAYSQSGTFTIYSNYFAGSVDPNPPYGSILNPNILKNGESTTFGTDIETNFYYFEMSSSGNILISGTNYYNNYYIYDEDLGRVAYGSLDSDSVVLSAGKHYINIDAYSQGGSFSIYSTVLKSTFNIEAVIDFDGDGIDDILWRNPTSGFNFIWYMYSDGTHIYQPIDSRGSDFEIAGVADFNGDSIADILWRSPTSGSNFIWYMNSDGTHTYGSIDARGTDYNIEDVADFNNDNIADILWRSPTSGFSFIWYMNSNGTHRYQSIGTLHTGYIIASTADFNGDGIADILWRNPTSGFSFIWYMYSDGTHIYQSIGTVSTSYQVAAAANFDGDSIADILWRSPSTGHSFIWQMSSYGTHNYKSIGTVSTDYQVAGVGNLNYDTIADIVWRNPSSDFNFIWYMYSNGSHTYQPMN